MANLLKEIGRRVTLIDIIEQANEADKYTSTLEEDKRFIYSANNLLKNACRIAFRMAGNLEAAIGTYLAFTSPEHIREALVLGSAGIAMYVLDYYAFDCRKKNDPK